MDFPRSISEGEMRFVKKRPFAEQSVGQNEDVFASIERQLGTKEDSMDVKELSALPIIDSTRLRRTIDWKEDQSIFSWVETDKIVGRPGSDHQTGGWAHEYEARKGRIDELVRQLRSEQGVERMFHQHDLPSERIKLTAINGPAGPMYAVIDGTHRVAGSKAAGLEKIPCDVYQIKYPASYSSTSEQDADDWRRKIELGLIQGSVEEKEVAGKKTYVLHVTSEIVPWMKTTSQYDFVRIGRLYEKLYPGSLDHLSVPREVFVDEIANNFFMAGRFDEWLKLSPDKR